MKFNLPHNNSTFEIPDEWWECDGMADYIPKLSHYCTDTIHSELVAIEDIEPPLRDEGIALFRNRETVIELLHGMRMGEKIPPIEIEKKCSAKHIVYDGTHRYYLSVAIGYTNIPIKVKFDFVEFFSNEERGI